jgi:hypothetical protein
MSNDPLVLVKLLRAMADSEDAKAHKHDVILNAAADEIERPTPTDDDRMAADNALRRALARFHANRPKPGSFGAITLMVEEAAVEIARARRGAAS